MPDMSSKPWEETGICPACRRQAISAGHCKSCGHYPAETTPPHAEPQVTYVEGFNDRSGIPGSIDDILSRY